MNDGTADASCLDAVVGGFRERGGHFVAVNSCWRTVYLGFGLKFDG